MNLLDLKKQLEILREQYIKTHNPDELLVVRIEFCQRMVDEELNKWVDADLTNKCPNCGN